MDGTTLDLSNRGLQQISDVTDMLAQCCQGIEMLNLSSLSICFFNSSFKFADCLLFILLNYIIF